MVLAIIFTDIADRSVDYTAAQQIISTYTICLEPKNIHQPSYRSILIQM